MTSSSSLSACKKKIAPEFIFHRLMLPRYIRKNADWNADDEGRSALQLVIPAGERNWESIFRIQLLPKHCFEEEEDLVVKIKVGATMPTDNRTNDGALFFGLSDKDNVIGMELNDPSIYTTEGPYRAVEGEWGRYALSAPNQLNNFVRSATINATLDQFEFMFKPSEAYGTAFCSADDGHKIAATYASALDLSEGLWLETFRSLTNSTFIINYIEVEIYKESSAI